VVFTEGKRSGLAVARGLHLPVDSVVTMDRGNLDYQLLFRAGHLHQQGVYFVTRQKVHAQVNVSARFAVNRATGVTADHDIVLTGAKGRTYPVSRRPVRYRDAPTGKRSGCWTKVLHLAATTIAALDKQR
jgi:hypothetical protein